MDDPLLPTPPLLLRLTHIATSACGCMPQVHLQAQAQAQPSEGTHDVLCLAHGARASSGAQLVVIALAHPLNSFLMRFSGAWGPDIEEGEYMYEWSDGSRGQGQTVRTAVCMALSPDLETLLCVTRDGIAYSFAVKSLLKTATRVPEEPSIDQNGWTSHLNPSLVDYTVDPRYARDNDPSSPGSLDHQAVSLGSTSVAGDFVPQCCVWWSTKGHLLTAIVAGHVGGSGALSIVDMDGEREIDMLYIPSGPTQPSKAWDTDAGALSRGAVTRLHLHPDPLLDPPPAPSSDDSGNGCPRFLLLELEDGSLHSVCLEAAYEASKPLSRMPSSSSLQGASAPLPTPPPTPTRDRPSPSLGQRLAKVGGAMVDASARRLRDPSSPLVSTRDPMPPLLQGLPLPEDTSQSMHNPELGSGSLWERCFLKTVGSPASPLPGAPHQPQINLWPQPEAPPEAGKEDAAHFLLRVVQMDGRLGALRAHATRRRGPSATDSSTPPASHPEWTLDLELVLSCASSPSGTSSRGDTRRPSHPPRRPAPPAFERRPLCTLALGPSAWADQLGPLRLQSITAASASDDTLLLSCLPSPPSRTSWLLCYHLPPSLLSSPPPCPTPPTLLRAFQCPTAIPPRPLHWLPPSHPTLHDTLNLASQGFLPWLQPRPSACPSPLVSVLLLHSPCTLYSLRTFPLTAPPPHRPSMPSELPSPCPGAVLQLLESMADKGRLADAIHLSTALLQGVTAGQPLPAPLLHMTEIAAADGHMQSLGGRAALAKRCLQWMLQARSDDAQLLTFLHTSRDGDPAQIEEVLLQAGKASMALRASYARGGDERLIATLHRLAQETDLPLTLDDMTWLGQRPQAARALFHVAHGGFAANLPPLMRLTILFQDPRLLIEQGQYEWLLTSLPTLPLPCLCALVRQLLTWLGLGGANWPSDEWHHMWDTQGPIRALQHVHAALLPAAIPIQAGENGAAQQEAISASEGNGPSPLPSPRTTGVLDEDDGARVLQLSQLLLFSLLLLAKPCLPSPAVLWCRSLSPPVPRCVSRMSPSQALALAAQSLAERLLGQWLGPTDVSARLTPALLLCKAMQADNLGVSALLLEALGRWDRALDLRLAETLRATTPTQTGSETKEADEEGEEERTLLLETLLTLVCRHVLRPPPSLLPLPQRLSMLSRVLHTWASLTLPVTRLEALAQPGEALGGAGHSIRLSGESTSQEEEPHGSWALHMLHTLLLELLVLQPPNGSAPGSDGEDSKTADEQEASSSGPFSLPWSEAFLIKLCRHAVDHGLEMQEQGVTDRWGTGAALGHDQELRPARREGALLRSFVEQVQGLVHDDPTHVVISERQLAEAMQANEGRQGGLMSRGGHMRSQSATTGTGPSRKVVVFNCGHVHSVHTLLTRALPELEATLCAPTRGARPLPLTAELLRREYEEGTGSGGNSNRGETGMLHLACPTCVAATLLSLSSDKL